MENEGQTTPSPAFMRLIFGRNPAWTVVRVLFVVFISIVLFKYVLVPIRVTGESMFPTCRNGQVKFVNKLAYWHHDPQRGDIVAVEFAGKDILLLKRILVLPGETFRVHNGYFYVNEKKLIEPYANGRIPSPTGRGYGSTAPVKLGPTEYLVMGDNRSVSEGYFKYRREIIGKVL